MALCPRACLQDVEVHTYSSTNVLYKFALQRNSPVTRCSELLCLLPAGSSTTSVPTFAWWAIVVAVLAGFVGAAVMCGLAVMAFSWCKKRRRRLFDVEACTLHASLTCPD